MWNAGLVETLVPMCNHSHLCNSPRSYVLVAFSETHQRKVSQRRSRTPTTAMSKLRSLVHLDKAIWQLHSCCNAIGSIQWQMQRRNLESCLNLFLHDALKESLRRQSYLAQGSSPKALFEARKPKWTMTCHAIWHYQAPKIYFFVMCGHESYKRASMALEGNAGTNWYSYNCSNGSENSETKWTRILSSKTRLGHAKSWNVLVPRNLNVTDAYEVSSLSSDRNLVQWWMVGGRINLTNVSCDRKGNEVHRAIRAIPKNRAFRSNVE